MWRKKFARFLVRGSTAVASTIIYQNISLADGYTLVPQTRIRVTVVQYVPTKGEYQRWDAIGGDFVVSAAGTIALPLVGTLDVGHLDNAELATKVAESLRTKTGLIVAPDVTVETLEHPPVYVVGGVTSPGAYPFRPGMTVLQALALSGGRYRQSAEAGLKDPVTMVGDLQGVRDEILRIQVRIARLQAESAGQKEIRVPPEFKTISNKESFAELLAQEQTILAARKNALDRQLDSLSELGKLLSAEIETLGKKAETLDRRLKIADDELASIRSLIDRGLAVVSRRSDLERAVVEFQSMRLDQVTALMRARQNLSEATRSALNLRDKHQTDVSTELQEARAQLERLKIKEGVVKSLLTVTDISMLSDRQTAEPSISFALVRTVLGGTEEITASEATSLLPGDVLKVAISEGPRRLISSGPETEGATAQARVPEGARLAPRNR